MDNYIEQLSVPSKVNRLTKLEQLSQDEKLKIDKDVIGFLIQVENVPSTITNYRDRERHLESVLRALRQDNAIKCENTHKVAVSCLLGSLYVNFEKFWEPTRRIIHDIIKQSKYQTSLLNLLLNHLKTTNDIIYNVTEAIAEFDHRPDHTLHRIFLLQVISRFQSNLETNNEVFINEFFRFAQNELYASPFIETFTRDNLVDSVDKKVLKEKRKTKETLLTATNTLQSFSDINNVHRRDELKELLLNLLCCRDGSVQKAVFNCIVVFDEENLKPHIERITKIMSDKMVRTEMTLFSIEDETINRAELMPILLRILFGKMIGKIGRKSTGKDKAEHRKDLVMRFISGCTQEEIEYFFGLLFDPIYMYSKTDYSQLESTLTDSIDLRRYVPLNKLHAMLNSLTSFMKSVAHQKEGTLHLVFKMINVIVFYVNHPLDNQSITSQIPDKKVDILKNLKRYCINTVSEFFSMFSYYSYSQSEIDYIFENLIWNSTQDFINRNYATPTPVLKLIGSFASNRVYHGLLIKRNKTNRDQFLLRLLIELYSDFKTTRNVNKFIASILADILDPERSIKLEDEEDERAIKEMLKVGLLKDVDCELPRFQLSNFNIDDTLQFNERILVGYIPEIFEVLKRNCQTFVDKKDLNNRIENDELILLSRLSKYLKDSRQSLLGVRLLLTTLPYQKKLDLIFTTLHVIKSLVKNIEKLDDPTIIRQLGELISYQRNPDQRKELCNIIKMLADIDSNLKTASEAIGLMNKSAGDMLDRPDFEACNEGYQLAFEYVDSLSASEINNPEVVRDSLLLLMFQSCYLIENIDTYEFTTRENCFIFFEKLGSKMQLLGDDSDNTLVTLIIEDLLLNRFIKKGLRDTNEAIKHLYIGILRSFAIHCHKLNTTLAELRMFCNDNHDLDFWINVKHIQLHNRSKALSLIVNGHQIEKTSSKTLSGYIMPLAAGFLFSKAYKSVSSLSENSIKLIGMICKKLNWVTYESTLSYYLGLLTKANTAYQKTNIKLITEILKNFNFDVTSCKEAMEGFEENAKLERRMKKRKGEQNEDDDSGAIATDAPSGKKLNPSTARMVYFGVTKKLIPKLNSCLHEMTRVEFEHDKNMADYVPEKDEIKRVPIAYAIVQLLNLLPNRYILFRDQLPTLFLKLCSFLKSKNEDIRRAARLTINRIMSFVGPAYMPDFLRVLKQNLDKGFQIHVLNYTIHSVLNKMPLTYGSLDNSVHELVKSCFQEIFGKPSEDKEIAQILAKTYEAKKTKSYDTLSILSCHISAEKFNCIMEQIRERLRTSDDGKKVNKLALCIQKVFNGLAQNDKFPLHRLLSLIQSLIEENIPNLRVREKVDVAANKLDSKSTAKREDRYIIEKDFSRDRIHSKINERSNSHMIVENCLRLLFQTLEKNKSLIKAEQKDALDGFIILLSTCLKSSSPRCVTRSLKCIHFIVHTKPDLVELKKKSNSIIKKIFILLSLYNGVGMVQGDNFEMIAMCFKTLGLMLNRCGNSELNETQIRALLSYIEQDLHDTNRQATAFNVLHSLLQRKYDSPELVDIMSKVGDLLVTSEDDSVRSLSIKIWQTYLLDYKHPEDKLQAHMSKFLRQLDYEHIDGRRSVLKMLTVIATKFPENLLRDYYDLMFHLLSQRIVNEESKEIRLLVGKLIGLLLQRLPDQQNLVFDKFIIVWASDSASKPVRLLGIKLTSIFLESCKGVFKTGKDKIKRILKTISGSLSDKNSKFELTNGNTNTEVTNGFNIMTLEDKLNYHSLRLFKRLLDKSLITPVESNNIDELSKIWQNISSQRMTDPQLCVVLTSCELYSMFIKKTNLGEALNTTCPSTDNYLEWNAKRIVRLLCDRYIDLLDRAEESEKLMAYITESMILLGVMIANSTSSTEFEEKYLERFDDKDVIKFLLDSKQLPSNGFVEDHLPYDLAESKKRVDLAWLSVKVVMQARKEAALYRLSKYHRRQFVLGWSAAMAQQLGSQRINAYVILFAMTPTRELTDKGLSNNNVKAMSEDLVKFLKGLLKVQTFNKIYSKLQLYFTTKRVDRKKKVLMSRVINPEKGTKRKLKESKKKTTVRKFKKIKRRQET